MFNTLTKIIKIGFNRASLCLMKHGSIFSSIPNKNSYKNITLKNLVYQK